MPPRKARLSRADFNNLSSRSTVRSPLFDITYTKGIETKVACVISKKRVKFAVERNRIRRKAYHAFKETGFSKPFIVIIYPRIEMLKAPFKETVVELSKVLDTLK